MHWIKQTQSIGKPLKYRILYEKVNFGSHGTRILSRRRSRLRLKDRLMAYAFYLERIDRCIPPGLPCDTPMGRLRHNAPAIRSRWLAEGFLALLAFSLASPLGAMPRSERHEIRHEIDHLEDHWRDAILSGNVTAMDALLAPDYMAITANGTLQSKDETLANMRSGTLRIKSIEISDRKVRFYGTTALVTSRAEVTGTTAEGDLNGSYRYTRVYVRDAAGVWRIVSFEASRIRDTDEHK
jgi:ketosteroid isomerase-like protein